MTRAEMRTMARKRLGETSGAFWSDAELNGWFDQAGKYIAWKSKSIRTNGYMTPTLDTSSYQWSAQFPTGLCPLKVYFNQGGTAWEKLDPIADREELEAKYPGWMNWESGTPIAYLFCKDDDTLEFFPAPDEDNDGTNYVRVYYAKQFTVLGNDDATPALPEPLHLAMVDWVVYMGYETRGYGEKANDALSKCNGRISEYKIESHREKEDDEYYMRPYRSC